MSEQLERLRDDLTGWYTHAKGQVDYYRERDDTERFRYHEGRESAYWYTIERIKGILAHMEAEEPTPQPEPTLPEQWREQLYTVLAKLDHWRSEASASEQRYYEDHFPKLHNYHHGSRLAYEVVREALQPLKALADAAPDAPTEPTSEPTPERFSGVVPPRPSGETVICSGCNYPLLTHEAILTDGTRVTRVQACPLCEYRNVSAWRDEAQREATTEPDPEAVPGFVRLHANRGEVLVNVSGIIAAFREGDDSIIICSGGFERAVTESPAQIAAAFRAAQEAHQ